MTQQRLVDQLALQPLGGDRFVGPGGDTSWLFGGRHAGQAVVAATQTVDDEQTLHSLHGHFLRRGDGTRPVELQVERVRDGRRFAARRVNVVQDARLLFTAVLSFQSCSATGPDHDEPVPLPGAAPPVWSGVPLMGLADLEEHALETGPGPGGLSAPVRYWARLRPDLGAQPGLHLAVLAYLSDYSTGLLHVDEGARAASSLDHALWVHRPVSLDDGVLVELVPRVVAGARGFYSGTVRDRRGLLLASLAQEMLLP